MDIVDGKNSDKKTLIIIISIVALIIFCLFVIPPFILSFEPDIKHGRLYLNLARLKNQKGELEDAKKYINLSLEHNPYDQNAKKLHNILNQ